MPSAADEVHGAGPSLAIDSLEHDHPIQVMTRPSPAATRPRRPRPTAVLLLPLLGLLALATSCRSVGRPVHLSSSPAGANILIDGRDSGFVTPVTLDLSTPREVGGPIPAPREIEFRLAGYEPASRTLAVKDTEHLIYWSDSTVFYLTGRFPLWLNWEDLLFPKVTQTGEWPSRIFVRLRRSTGG